MQVYLMRHGFAGDVARDPKKERDRPLTPHGRAQVMAIAKELKRRGEEPKAIFTSMLVRAFETADIVGATFGIQVQIDGVIGPLQPLWREFREIIDSDRLKRVMLVGHHDNLEPLISRITGEDADHMMTAEVRKFVVDRESGDGEEKFELRPSDLGLPDLDSKDPSGTGYAKG